MARFIETNVWNKQVNLDRAVTAIRQKDNTFRLTDGEGETLGHIDEDPRDLSSPIVPAHPGVQAVCIYTIGEEARPTEVFVERFWVRAWQVVHGMDKLCAVPIGDAEIPGGYLIEQPDGRLLGPCDEQYRNIEEALTERLAEAQRRWDQKMAETGKKAAE